MCSAKSMEAATATDIGTRETNQDRVFAEIGQVVTDGNHLSPYGLFCVADGMGGLQEGEYAASVAIDKVEDWWNNDLKNTNLRGAEVLDAFFGIFQSINDTIRQHGQKGKLHLGTTCSLLLIYGDEYYIAHTGDSRIYQVDTGWFASFIKPMQLTEDHNWLNDQIKKGQLSPSEIANHPKRNILTSCLGAFERPKIFTHTGTINRPCTFILSSDGLYKVVKDKELAVMARKYKDSKTLADNLISYALKQGANDNVSAVVVKVERAER